jgi:tetratricopeptide (TPR) repeat protein
MKKMMGLLLLAGLLTSFSLSGFAMAGQESDSLRLVLEKAEGPVQQAAIIKQLSRLALSEGDYPLAIEYLNRELDLRVVTGDSVSWANAHYNLGMIFSMIRSFDKAIHHSLIALEYFERSRLYNEVANTCLNL